MIAAIFPFLTGNLWRTGLLAVVAFAGVQTWRVHSLKGDVSDMRDALEQAALDLYTAERNLIVATSAIARQSAAVDALAARGASAARNAEAALREARRVNRALSEDIGRIKARKVTGCETGAEIMEAGL